MAATKTRPKGYVGVINGLVITKKMVTRESKALPVINEFLLFIEALNGGRIR